MARQQGIVEFEIDAGAMRLGRHGDAMARIARHEGAAADLADHKPAAEQFAVDPARGRHRDIALIGEVTLGRQAVAYTSAGDQPQDGGLIRDTRRRIVYYQNAYVNALRCQLRGQDPWPELEPFLSKEEIASLRGEKNAAAEIQRRMALLIQDSGHRGWLGPIHLGLLYNGLTELANAQGGCERIKNTPMPKHYDYFIGLVVRVYCILLPFGMVANLGLLTPIGSSLLGFGFFALENIGRDLEHPFDNSVHDIAMTSICRTIEINLKQYLGEADLPAPIEPVRGVLW